MAILIPCRNIYNIDNPKVKNNIINSVTVGIKTITEKRDVDAPVFQLQRSSSVTDGRTPPSFVLSNIDQVDEGGSYFTYNLAISGYQQVYYCKFENVVVPRLQNNVFVDNVFFVKSDGESNINYRVIGDTKTASAYYTLNWRNGRFDGIMSDEIIYDDYPLVEKQNQTFTNPFPIETNNGKAQSTLNAPVTASNLYDISYVFDEASDAFIIPEIRVICGYDRVTKMTATKKDVILGADNTVSFNFSGTQESFTPKQIELSLYGTTVTLNITEKNIVYGDGDRNHSIESNELFQNVAVGEVLSSNIIKGYSKGKETATILCDISDYYEYDPDAENKRGNKVISPNDTDLPMVLVIGDVVMPMIAGVRGEEPMSRRTDGAPKEFRVVGTSIIYDGAVWQKISLQEL